MQLANNPDRWQWQHGAAEPTIRPSVRGGMSFPFPAGQIDYLLYPWQRDINRISVNARVKVTRGEPVIRATENGAPGQARVIIYRDMDDDDGRWWSRLQAIDLVAGNAGEIDAKTADLNEWSNVDGKLASNRRAQFRACVWQATHVGLTFGGGGHFGHGVKCAGGKARMIIERYEVT